MKHDSIAVVGMAGRFPGGGTLSEYWELIRDGRAAARVVAAPATQNESSLGEWVAIEYPFPAPVDQFDADLFQYNAREAELLDPQHRIFHECVWEALERAGYANRATEHCIGIFASAGYSYYQAGLIKGEAEIKEGAHRVLALQGNEKDALATRIAFRLNLKGPALTVQTYCSSSLVAIQLAVESLRTGQCDVAVAGGVALRLPAGTGYQHLTDNIYSKDGLIRPFDDKASGTVFGSGVGAIVLRRRHDAENSGDQIWAQIRGAAIDNDGSGKHAYSAPSMVGQERVLRAALEDAGVAASSISYIEAHGTGTRVGDPIECSAISRVYGGVSPISMGSVKGNIGHLDAASGVAAIIKACLMLRHRTIPPICNFSSLNREIQGFQKNLSFPTIGQIWQGDQPRRCGISSFGIGGTNAHVILEEYVPGPRPEQNSPSVSFLPISARNKEAVAEVERELLASGPDGLANKGYTLACRRSVYPFRSFILLANGTNARREVTFDRAEIAAVNLGSAPVYLPAAVGQLLDRLIPTEIASPEERDTVRLFLQQGSADFQSQAAFAKLILLGFWKRIGLDLRYLTGDAADIRLHQVLREESKRFSEAFYVPKGSGGAIDSLCARVSRGLKLEYENALDQHRVVLAIAPQSEDVRKEAIYVFDPASADPLVSFSIGLGKLWCAVGRLDFRTLFLPGEKIMTDAPIARLDRRSFWARECRVEGSSNQQSGVSTANVAATSEIRLLDLLADVSGSAIANDEREHSLTSLGFDSLLLSQVAAEISRTFGVPMTVRALLTELDTPKKLAQALERSTAQASISVSKKPRTDSVVEGDSTLAHGPYRGKVAAITEISDEQRAAISRISARYNARTKGSKEIAQRHRKHFADPRAAGGFNRVWKEMVYPIVVERSKGAILWDVDGNRYVDVTLGFGANYLGHSPDYVNEAICRQIESGYPLGPQIELSGIVADKFCRLTGHERMTFCNTGSEAVIAGLRVARTVTRRDKIVVFAGSYHGIFDSVLVRGGRAGVQPIAPGIPRGVIEDTMVLAYGEETSLTAIADAADEIAAVLVEPVQARHLGKFPIDFLRKLRQVTAEHGIVLIFDEIITGFRCHLRGAKYLVGVDPDLATYGKILGGGLPIGALAGRRQYMDSLDGGSWSFGDDTIPEAETTFFAGTFVRHPLAITAANAVLDHLVSAGEQLQESVNLRTARFASELNGLFTNVGVSLRVEQFSSLFNHMVPKSETHWGLLYFLLRERGVHSWEGRVGHFSAAHSDEDCAYILKAYQSAIDELVALGLVPINRSVAPASPLGNEVDISPLERDVWEACQVSEARNCAYTVCVPLLGHVVVDALEIRRRAMRLCEAHPRLRSTFSADGLKRRVAERLEIEIEDYDFTDGSHEAAERRSVAIFRAHHDRPWNLERGPLFRVSRIALPRSQTLVFLASHHCICDGQSMREISKDFCDRNWTPGWPVSSGATTDLKPVQDDQAVQFWGRYLEGVELPQPPLSGTERPPELEETFECVTVDRHLSHDAYARLTRFVEQRRQSPFSVSLTAAVRAMFKLKSSRELLLGLSISGRSLFGYSRGIGNEMYLCPLRFKGIQEQGWEECLVSCREVVAGVMAAPLLPYNRLIQLLKLSRRLYPVTLTPIIFEYDSRGPSHMVNGEAWEAIDMPRPYHAFELNIVIRETDGRLFARVNYRPQIYSGAFIDCLIEGIEKEILHLPDEK